MNPELDKLASAAIDGEATPAELAAVSGDPAFAASKAELENVSRFVAQSKVPSAPEGLALSQISIAMDAFRAESAHRAVKAAEPVRAERAGVRASKRSWTMPGWLTPALFSVAVIAGVGFAAANLATNSQSDDAASGVGDASLEAATTTAAADSAELIQEEGAFGDIEDLASDTPANESGVPLFETPGPIDLTGSYFVGSRNLRANDVAKLATAPVPPIAPDSYDRCGEIHGFDAPPGELNLVIPFLYDSEPAELLVYSVGAQDRVTLIVNDACEVLDQS